MASATALKPAEPEPQKRLTRRPKGLGPLYTLCPRCKGTGISERLSARDTAADPRCVRCDGKGIVLE